MIGDRDDPPYQVTPGAAPAPPPVDEPSQEDERDVSTLKSIHKSLNSSMADLRAWDAFNLDPSEKLTVEQQIAVNERVYSIVAPLEEQARNAIQRVEPSYMKKG